MNALSGCIFRHGDSTFKQKFIMIYIQVVWVWVACAQSDRVGLVLCRKSVKIHGYLMNIWSEVSPGTNTSNQPDKEGLTDRANISNFRQLFFIFRRMFCSMITNPFMLTETQVIQPDLNRKMCYAKNDCFKILHRLFFVFSSFFLLIILLIYTKADTYVF